MVNNPYAKFIVAIIGAGVTAALGVVAPDTLSYNLLTIGLAVVTAASVYFTPNGATPGTGRHVDEG